MSCQMKAAWHTKIRKKKPEILFHKREPVIYRINTGLFDTDNDRDDFGIVQLDTQDVPSEGNLGWSELMTQIINCDVNS